MLTYLSPTFRFCAKFRVETDEGGEGGGDIERMSPAVESRADRGVPKTCFRCLVLTAHAEMIWVGGVNGRGTYRASPPL